MQSLPMHGVMHIRFFLVPQIRRTHTAKLRWSLDASSILFEDCLFAYNRANSGGGAVAAITGDIEPWLKGSCARSMHPARVTFVALCPCGMT